MSPALVGSSRHDRPRRRHRLTALLETITLYGLLGWAYAAVHPNYLAGALTHWLALRRDTFGALCFAASTVGFLLLNVRGDQAGRQPVPLRTEPPMSVGQDQTGPTRRVLLVSHYFPPHVGGIENVVEGEAIHLAKAGHEVTVLTTATVAGTGVEYAPDGYSVVRLRTWNGIEQRTGVPFPVLAPWTVWTAARLVRNVDVVHAHDVLYMTTWFVAIMAKLLGKPLVLTQHVQLIAHPRGVVEAVQRLVYATVGRAVVGSAARIAVVNSGVADFLRALGARGDRIMLVANGTDTDRFHPATAEDKQCLRRTLGLPEHGVLALFVGRFVPKKGYDKLLRAAGNGYTLVLAGGLTPPGFSDRTDVIFVGSRTQDQLADLYRACDMFVLPSESEGFPLTVQEAMASGLPVITSDDPGYDFYRIDRNRVAFIRPTVSEIKSTLERLAADVSLRGQMARYSSSIAASRFSWNEHVRRLEQMYDAAFPTTGSRTLAPDELVRRDVSKILRHRLLPAVLRTVFGYGLLIWVYVAVNSLTHPETMPLQLTHFLAWPLEGDTGSMCFALSAVAFLVLRMRAEHDRAGAWHGG